ncbi:uncharacterized protein B0T15DRAFT_541866 [Chaetomium strumarium]|uniref:Secreted protein n=1 Tax=Chaetomium strumarium TaxID=1170767 RepID=A0AAJ0LY63_9PEZI|nr:hypothetical protein B0T15DRAFT_541866 [Chaetomium strumarium]
MPLPSFLSLFLFLTKDRGLPSCKDKRLFSGGSGGSSSRGSGSGMAVIRFTSTCVVDTVSRLEQDRKPPSL